MLQICCRYTVVCMNNFMLLCLLMTQSHSNRFAGENQRASDQSLVLYSLIGRQHRPNRTPGPHSFGSGDGRCQSQHPGSGEAGRSCRWHQDRGAGWWVRIFPSTWSAGGKPKEKCGVTKIKPNSWCVNCDWGIWPGRGWPKWIPRL